MDFFPFLSAPDLGRLVWIDGSQLLKKCVFKMLSKYCCMNYVVCVKHTLFPVQMTHPQKATGCCYDYDDDCDDDNDDVEDNVG